MADPDLYPELHRSVVDYIDQEATLRMAPARDLATGPERRLQPMADAAVTPVVFVVDASFDVEQMSELRSSIQKVVDELDAR